MDISKIKNLRINISKIKKSNKNFKLRKEERIKNLKMLIALLATANIAMGAGISTFLIQKLVMPHYHERVSDVSSLYKSIEENTNLDKNEKKILNYVSEFIDEYYYYMDKNEVEDKLSNFDIEYKTQKDKNVTGSWNSMFCDMTFYTMSSSKDLKNNSEVVSHELYHLLSGDIYNKCLAEGIASLINYEYSDYENQDSYYKQLLIAQILCEIIDPELVVKSYLQADTSIITDELFKIDNNKTRYKRLFKNLTRYQEVFNKYLEYTEVDLEKGSYNDYLNLKNIEEDLLKSIKSDLKFYYDHSKNRKDEATVKDYFDKLTTDYDIVVNSNNNKNKIVYVGDYNTESKYLRKTK
ncbi:MAG: hypothetical protein KHW57_05975 [Clostridium sp.]|jgi:hypothetical protein|nr:hypothetical protein [Clostridium sp.]MEE0092519.1 hypothetical protein [Bacilli bacterium]